MNSKIYTLMHTDDQLDKMVKIQGTEFDRKRKVSSAEVKKMKKLWGKGKSFGAIAKEIGYNYTTVRYNIDDAWRAQYIAKQSGKHTGKDNITTKNRVAYKRRLVAYGQL